jgi:hypothetical protein
MPSHRLMHASNFNRFQNKMPFALVVEWNGMEWNLSDSIDFVGILYLS